MLSTIPGNILISCSSESEFPIDTEAEKQDLIIKAKGFETNELKSIWKTNSIQKKKT
jgi:hypothetical protein